MSSRRLSGCSAVDGVGVGAAHVVRSIMPCEAASPADAPMGVRHAHTHPSWYLAGAIRVIPSSRLSTTRSRDVAPAAPAATDIAPSALDAEPPSGHSSTDGKDMLQLRRIRMRRWLDADDGRPGGADQPTETPPTLYGLPPPLGWNSLQPAHQIDTMPRRTQTTNIRQRVLQYHGMKSGVEQQLAD
jgi:hypothetical protein